MNAVALAGGPGMPSPGRASGGRAPVEPGRAMRRGLALSLGLHAVVLLTLVGLRVRGDGPLPTMYRVNLVGAPAGPRAAGVVRDAPGPTARTARPPQAETNAADRVAPIGAPDRRRAATRATTNVTPEASRAADRATAPTAGSGRVGGTGTDVATIRTEGIDFPFPGYLQNIVRQIALDFRPRNPGASRAEVFFLIRRDGSVTGFRFVQRSGNYAFDLEAEAAVEAAATRFGPLPAAFADDILPVSFSFDPARLR